MWTCRLAAEPNRLPLLTPCARNAHGVVECSAFLAARVSLTHAAAKEQVMSFIGASRHKARSCPNRLPRPPSPRRLLFHLVPPLYFLKPASCDNHRCSHSCRSRSRPCGDASTHGLSTRPVKLNSRDLVESRRHSVSERIPTASRMSTLSRCTDFADFTQAIRLNSGPSAPMHRFRTESSGVRSLPPGVGTQKGDAPSASGASRV